MALSTKLEMRQGQQLVMTPQLQQAIRLLQLSNIELTQFVETELERNPLLEADEGNERRCARKRRAPESPSPKRPAPASETGCVDLDKPVADPEGTFDTEDDNVYPDSAAPISANGPDASGWASLRQRAYGSGDDVNLEAFVANDVSLREHLTDAAPRSSLNDPAERLIGQYLVDMVDEAGYLPRRSRRSWPTSWARRWRVIEKVLAALQTLRSAWRLRALAGRMPGAAAQGAEPLRSADRQLLDNLHLLASHNFAALQAGGGRRHAKSSPT